MSPSCDGARARPGARCNSAGVRMGGECGFSALALLNMTGMFTSRILLAHGRYTLGLRTRGPAHNGRRHMCAVPGHVAAARTSDRVRACKPLLHTRTPSSSSPSWTSRSSAMETEDSWISFSFTMFAGVKPVSRVAGMGES